MNEPTGFNLDPTIDNYDRRFGKEKLKEPRNYVVNFLDKYKDELKNQKILEIACGNGRNLPAITKIASEVHAIEISPKGLEIAKNNNPTVELKQGDFHNLPFEDSSFRAAIASNVFQHNNWQGAQKSFSEATRVTESGGLIFIYVSSTKRVKPVTRIDIDENTYIPGNQYDKKGETIHHFSKEEIDILVKENNLEILELDEIVQEKPDGPRGHWNLVFRKK